MKYILALMRPRTLLLAVAVILTGSALAFYHQAWNPVVFCLTLSTTLALQILANIANDYGDGIRGADRQRLGPERLFGSGKISARHIQLILWVWVLITACSGLLLLGSSMNSWAEGVLFLSLGLTSIVAAIKYTLGRRAYGYYGFGEVAVFLYFGLLGICGSFYIQAHFWQWSVLLPAIGCGALSAAVLHVNNMRDIDTDQAVQKNTLAVRIGLRRSRWLHLFFIVIAMLCYFAYAVIEYLPLAILFLCCLLPTLFFHSIKIFKAVNLHDIGVEFKSIVIHTFLVNILFSLGLILKKIY